MAELVGKRVRCAVYTRKSSEEGLEQSFNSLHAQREACEAYVTSQKHEGWQLLPTPYDDGGFSGGSMERPGLKSLMADVAAGLIDTVVVYKVHRLTRSLADFAKMVELFDTHGVSFVSVTQAFNTTTSMGRLTLNVLLSFAQFEREVTGERIRDKIAASKAKGMWMGGAVPLGYDVVDRQLVVNEPEAAQVRQLFTRYLALKSVDDLVAEADQRQIRSKLRTTKAGATSGGTPLGRGSLYSILANPIYVGEVGHKGKRFPGQHTGIVIPELFDAVQALLNTNRRKRKGPATATVPPMLSGLVRDADGERLTATHTQKGKRRYRYYAGPKLRIPAEELEELVAYALCEHLAAPAKLATLLPSLDLLTPALLAKAAETAHALGQADAKQRRKLAEQMISVVVVTDDAVTLTLDLAGLGVAGTGTLTISASIGRARARLSLVVPGMVQHAPDAALIGMVAQARSWFEQVASGGTTTLASIAAAENINEAYVRQMIGAAFLAPDLVTAIVEGRQPRELSLARLKTMLPLPTSWPEQRALFAQLA
ncbi:recombinase family protein [Sphingomonas aerophila]|uniref:DNA invertase Pin-like site-specific DNA recombinase n=1 Tax=Sphingomonas aerophila TaxID=1344948 RepID=A0A7W9ETG2_9SPHN|nr:recombinase family protein [Sphingomonas aerophila]MBB5714125.1 DNA invertase Pin-like site-specific DNA recombinase [Sphingomonas aerophila]